jgi:hypothetical protein
MRKIYILFLFPLFVFSHITDERLFTTSDVPSSVMILLDRSTSMDETTFNYEVLVRLNDFNNGNRDDELNGWYDSTLIPDGPGSMGDFDGQGASSEYLLEVDWSNWWTWRTPRIDLTWTLMIKSGGSWYTYNGGSHTWYGRSGSQSLTIDVTGLGDIEDIQCYLDIELDYMDIEDMQIDLIKTPRDTPYESTRIRDALLVIHSLLDANNDGLITEEDEENLSVKIAQGCHRTDKTGRVFVPLSTHSSYYDSDLGYSYNETTHNWDNVGGGTMYTDTIGTHFADVWSHINYTDLGTYTPNGMLIGHAVESIEAFRTSHPELWCMQHCLILITDGEPNAPRETCSPTSSTGLDYEAGSKDMVREAYMAWHDHDIKVFAVGFGTDITDDGARALNWAGYHGGTQAADSAFIDSMVDEEGMDVTAVDGSSCGMDDPRDHFLTGYAYIASDANTLASALGKIFREISGYQNRSFTSAEVTSVEEEFLSTEYQSRLYVASFLPDTTPFWRGDLRALKLTAGVIDLDDIPDSILIWSAGDSLANDAADSRPIYGIKSNALLQFDTTNFDASDLDVSSSEVSSVIDRIRDGNTDDNLGYLGDIFHSSPLRIQSPNYFYEDEGWDSFYNVISKNRSSLIYAGGNDGMLHVFADTIFGQAGRGGHEIVSIIPMNFVSKVRNLSSTHDYFVDGNPMAADVWFPSSNVDSTKEWNEWHTVLIAPQGEGGRAFTALDVTDPLNETVHTVTSLNFLFDSWQSDTLKERLGYTTSSPIMYKVGVDWTGYPGRYIDRFYAFFGGGQFPDPMDISLVDSISAGSVKGNDIITFDVWAATSGIDGNIIFIPSAEGSMDYPFVATPAIINVDPQFGNRYDYLFITDAAGQLWFVNLKVTNPLEWRARKIFQPPLPASSDSAEIYNWHPSYYRPLIWKDPAYGGYWIAYGTGNRSNIFGECAERFYALHYDLDAFGDTSNIPLYSEDSLGSPGSETDCGWMLQLTHDREKVVTPAIYFQDSLEFFTFSPGGSAEIGPCEIGGTGSAARAYTMHIRTGNSFNPEGIVAGSGMPQPPSYSFSISGEGKKVVQSGGTIQVLDIGSFMSFRQHILWKDEDRD